jgi:APA family basic amino acid/polyamine antiporter
MNGMILTGSRVYFAMARDGDFLASFGRLGSRSRVPTISILVQGFWAAALTLLGDFQQLFTSVIFMAWLFYGITVAAVIVLRIRYPKDERPFLTPGYPIVPLSFVAAAGVVVASAIASDPRNALSGSALMLLGYPVYLIFAALHKKKYAQAQVSNEEVKE